MSDVDEGLVLFDCPRHTSLRLTDVSCAAMWLKAAKLPAKSVEPVMKCRGCAIGAGHAGRPVEESVAVAKNDLLCTRCGRGAMKFVEGRICISCYNREREWCKGINARGTAPVRAKPLRPFEALVLDPSGNARFVRIERVAHGVEGRLSILRKSTEQLGFVADFRTSLLALEKKMAAEAAAGSSTKMAAHSRRMSRPGEVLRS